MNGHVLSALQFRMIKLKRDLRIVIALSARLYADDVPNEPGAFGNCGAIRSFYIRPRLDHDRIAGLRGLAIELVDQFTVDRVHCGSRSGS